MILVDANLLIYATIPSDSRHEPARYWLDRTLDADARVGLPWESLNAFVRIVTHPKIYERPVAMSDAMAQVSAWLGQPNVWAPVPTDRHASYLDELVRGRNLAAGDIHDAHLAALAISHGLKVASHDAGFARFPACRWFDPLVA